MTRFLRQFGRLGGLLALALFVWMSSLHAEARLKRSLLPIEIQLSAADICGDASETLGWGGHCPFCIVGFALEAAAAPDVFAPPETVRRMVFAPPPLWDGRAPNKRHAPVRAPPRFT